MNANKHIHHSLTPQTTQILKSQTQIHSDPFTTYSAEFIHPIQFLRLQSLNPIQHPLKDEGEDDPTFPADR
jgi:hypothetical protein